MSRSDCCLYTLVIGDHPYYPYAVQNHSDYADFIGVDHVVQKELTLASRDGFIPHVCSLQSIFYEKIFRIKELSKLYKRILFVDADIFIRPQSPSIFEHYVDINCDQMWGVVEGMAFPSFLGRMTNAMPLEDVFDGASIKYVQMGSISFPVYVNAGMWLIGYRHPLLSLLDEKEAQDVARRTYFLDQDYPSYLISRHQLDFNMASGHWNFFDRSRGLFPHAINHEMTWPYFFNEDQKFISMDQDLAYFIHCFCWRHYPFFWNQYYEKKILFFSHFLFKFRRILNKLLGKS